MERPVGVGETRRGLGDTAGMGTHPNARFRRVRCRPSSLPRRDTNTTLLDASMAHLEPRRRLWEFARRLLLASEVETRLDFKIGTRPNSLSARRALRKAR